MGKQKGDKGRVLRNYREVAMLVQSTEMSYLDIEIQKQSHTVSNGFGSALAKESQFYQSSISWEYEFVQSSEVHTGGLLQEHDTSEMVSEYAGIMDKVAQAENPADFYSMLSELKQRVLDTVHELLSSGISGDGHFDSLRSSINGMTKPSLFNGGAEKSLAPESVQKAWGGVQQSHSVSEVQRFELSIQLIEIEQNSIVDPGAGFAVMDPCNCNYRSVLNEEMIESWIDLLDRMEQRLAMIRDISNTDSEDEDSGFESLMNMVKLFKEELGSSQEPTEEIIA